MTKSEMIALLGFLTFIFFVFGLIAFGCCKSSNNSHKNYEICMSHANDVNSMALCDRIISENKTIIINNSAPASCDVDYAAYFKDVA